jgi:hypothetical protein
MAYFNINAFYLGVLISAIACLTSLIYCLICIIWGIKILEATLFASPWFSIFKQKILGTDFKLGWIPTGSSISPLGYLDDQEERSKINPSDRPSALFSKPKFVKYLFALTPVSIYFLSFVIISLSQFDLVDGTSNIFNFIFNAIKEMFTGNGNRADFIIYTKKILVGKNHVLFSYLVIDILLLVYSIPVLFLNFIYSSDKISEKSKERLQILFFLSAGLFALWIMVWKIPKFMLSFFTLTQSLIYLFSFIAGLFTLGFVFFFTSVFIIKSIAQNLNYNNPLKNDT